VGPNAVFDFCTDVHEVDVAGKTIMPLLINPHGHAGYMRGSTTGAENFSRDSVLDYLR
jgi:imidazolonepropionase-like amidohydrolase